MKTYIALFRGINVGGNNMLPMKEPKEVLEKAACADVRTYIQSGNVIFRCAMTDTARLEKRLAAAVSKTHGFEPRVLVLTQGEIEGAANGNPFPEAVENPATLHLFFLPGRPKNPNLKAPQGHKAHSGGFRVSV